MSCASKETREAWKQVVEAIREVDPVLADKCVPECLYRGFCPEFMNPCGYSKTKKFEEDLQRICRDTETQIMSRSNSCFFFL